MRMQRTNHTQGLRSTDSQKHSQVALAIDNKEEIFDEGDGVYDLSSSTAGQK